MEESSPVLKRILSADCCTGCGLCQAMFEGPKIEMRLTGPGFLRPTQIGALSAEDDQLLKDTCPGIRLDLPASQIKNHPIWGPVITVRTGAATDQALRHEASSGGVLSALLCYLLDENKIEYAVHTAMSQSSPIENQTVETRLSKDVLGTCGSRYSPSAPLRDLDTYINRSEPFALVGKPCDVAAARAYGRHDPRVKETVPYMLSFYCAGVSKLDGTRQILSEMGVAEKDLTNFRYRGDGWPGFAMAQTRDGKTARMSYADSWGNILSHHTQFRCKICPDGSGGFADVVCGDAWYSDDKGYPKFDEEDGRSLIISRTPRGEELVQAAIKAGYIEVMDLDIGEIQKMQPSQANRKRLVTSRLLAMRLITGFRPNFTGLNLAEAAASAPVRLRLRNFLGMARRLVLRRKG